MPDDFLTMTESQLVNDKTPTSGFNYPDVGQVYDPNRYTSITKKATINRENPSGIPLASEKTFGLVTAGEGLRILRDGFIALNVGAGFSIDPTTKKLILSATIYPRGGDNIEIGTTAGGEYVVNVKGDETLYKSSLRVATSKAVAEYVKGQTGDVELVPSPLKTGGQDLVSIINSLYEKSHFSYYQATSEKNWVIDHPLKKNPAVTITTEDGIAVVGEVVYHSINSVIVRFSAGFSGSAFLN